MEQTTNQQVAVFDVDGTLLLGDCMSLAVRRSKGLAGQLLAALVSLPWLIGWQLRLVSTGRFKQQIIAAFGVCKAVNQAEAAGRADWLLSQLRADVRPEALQRLLWHQQRGDRVLLCSASPRLLLQPLADWLGVELLCTELEQAQGQWRPRLAGPNCKGPEKVRRLEQHLGPLDCLTIEAYGDSKGDRELLQAAVLPHYRSFLSEPHPYPAFTLGPLLPVVALALLGYGLLGIWSQGDQLLPLLRSLWPQISLGLLLVFVSYGIRYGRWRLLLRAVNQHPPLSVDARIWMGSYAFTATPGKSGEAVRSLLLKQECGVPVPPTLMALVVERLTDGTAVLLLLLINLPLLLRWQVPLAVPIGIALVALILGLIVLRSTSFKAQIKSNFKRLLPRKLTNASGDVVAALRLLLKPTLLLQATLIGSVAWGMEGVCLWLLLRGMDIEFVGLGAATVAHVAACLFGILTFLPGGLGSTEVATTSILAFQGVSVHLAVAAAILMRLMTMWLVSVIGIFSLGLGNK